jgi:hypothetical protein
VPRASYQLNGAANHLLPNASDQRVLDQGWRRSLRLACRMLRAEELALAHEQRRQPFGVEHVHHRIDQLPALERTHQLSGTAHGQLARAGHVNDRVVSPIGHQAASAPSGSEPRRARVSDAPDAEFAVFYVGSDQGGLERRRRTETTKLFRMQGATGVEAQTQYSLIGLASRRQLFERREQQAEAGGASFLCGHGRLERH